MYVVLREQSGDSSALADMCVVKCKDQTGAKEVKALIDWWLDGRSTF